MSDVLVPKVAFKKTQYHAGSGRYTAVIHSRVQYSSLDTCEEHYNTSAQPNLIHCWTNRYFTRCVVPLASAALSPLIVSLIRLLLSSTAQRERGDR